MRTHRMDHKIIYVILAAGALIFMQIHSEDTGFWYDELAQVCYSREGNTLLDTISILDPTPPLFSVIANLWMRIAPYGERWLLILPQIAVAGAVVVTGIWVEGSFGTMAGVLAAFFLGTSQIVIEQCGLEFRSYGLYLLLSAAAFAAHDCYISSDGDRRPLIGFAAALTGFMYAHMFGIGICAVMCFADIVVYGRKKSWKQLAAPYLCAVTFFLPWLVCFIFKAGAPALASQQSWMAKPTVWEVIKLFGYLCGNNPLIFLLFVVGAAEILVKIWRAGEAEADDTMVRKKGFLLLVSAVSVLGVYVYGKVLRPDATLWVKRYFTGLTPCCVFVMSSAFGSFFQQETLNWKRKRGVGAVLAILCVAAGGISLYRVSEGDSPFTVYYHREAAEILANQEDSTSDGTIVLSTLGDYVEGWEYYYFTLRGVPGERKIASIYGIEPEELKKYQVVYVESGFPGEAALIQDALDQGYVLEKSWEDVALYKYRLNHG